VFIAPRIYGPLHPPIPPDADLACCLLRSPIPFSQSPKAWPLPPLHTGQSFSLNVLSQVREACALPLEGGAGMSTLYCSLSMNQLQLLHFPSSFLSGLFHRLEWSINEMNELEIILQ
jgi:hypothetical protein